MKIKIRIAVVFLILSINAFPQEILHVEETKWLCTYNYEFLEDSTSRYSLKSEQMILQVGLHLSKFCSENELIKDSFLYVNKNKDIASSYQAIHAARNGHSTHIFCRYKVYKNYPEQGKTNFSSFQGGTFLSVTEICKFHWIIDEHKDTIMIGFHCQKALTSYAGRNYIAWFSSEIPINDGPYKFQGLPGLIVKISDTRNQHCFTLTGIKKVIYPQSISYNKSNYIEVTAAEFVRAMEVNVAKLFGKVQSNDIKFNNDEGKARSLQGLKAKNNFIEKY